MLTNLKKRNPEIVFKNGKPSAVIIDIREYEELLEQVEDTEDIKVLRAMRKKPLRYTKLDDVLKAI